MSEQLAIAIEAAIKSPVAFLSLVLIVLAIVLPKLISKDDHKGIRYAVVISLLVFAFAGFSLTVLGNYLAAEPKMDDARPPVVERPTPADAQVGTAPPPEPRRPAESRRVDCGTAWTRWIEVGGGVGNPCPAGCERGAELGQSYRAVGFPPRPQTRHNFQCWRPG